MISKEQFQKELDIIITNAIREDIFKMIAQQGFTRVRVDNNIETIHDKIILNKNKKHNIDILIDRLVISDNISQRLTESIELALKAGNGLAIIQNVNGDEY